MSCLPEHHHSGSAWNFSLIPFWCLAIDLWKLFPELAGRLFFKDVIFYITFVLCMKLPKKNSPGLCSSWDAALCFYLVDPVISHVTDSIPLCIPLGHSVGSKRHLWRLERRAGSFASPRVELWLPGCVWNATPRSLSALERNIRSWTQA